MSWSCFRRPVSRKYLQKKSLGTTWYRQKIWVKSMEFDRRGRPAKSTGGHTNVHVGLGEVVVVDEVVVVVEELVEELVDVLVDVLVELLVVVVLVEVVVVVVVLEVVLLVVEDVVVVAGPEVDVVVDVVVVGTGFLSDGTHSSRRWISSGWAGPNWLFVNVCTVPNAEFLVL